MPAAAMFGLRPDASLRAMIPASIADQGTVRVVPAISPGTIAQGAKRAACRAFGTPRSPWAADLSVAFDPESTQSISATRLNVAAWASRFACAAAVVRT